MPAAPRPILEVRDLRTYFFPEEGTVKAVDGAHFDVYPRKTLGIVGESGCGKSVTARSILRIIERPGRIVSGSILLRREGEVEGIDLTRLDPDGREMRRIRGEDVALIFQEPMTSFSPVHTVGNQMIENIRLHQDVGKLEARARAVDMLRQVGVSSPEQRVDQYAFELSGGLRQRAMIALALSCHPRILIADEPTTALDVTTQAQILDLLATLQQREGMAIILITHNLGVVAGMCERVLVMYAGRVVEEGPTDEVFSSPKHPYTWSLLRSLPRLDSDERKPLRPIEGMPPDATSLPSGCAFHPRCPFAVDRCLSEAPALEPLGSGRLAACWVTQSGKDLNQAEETLG